MLFEEYTFKTREEYEIKLDQLIESKNDDEYEKLVEEYIDFCMNPKLQSDDFIVKAD